MVRETSEKISVVREKIKEAQSQQKSYADQRRKDLEFNVGDYIFLKVALVRAVVMFGQKRDKLSSCYIGPFEVPEHVGKVSYKRALPPKMLGIHIVFNISMLRKYIHVDTHVIDLMT